MAMSTVVRIGLLLAALALLPGIVRAAEARYVGSAACAACHKAESEAWRSSHHARSMQPATPVTVLGDFGGVRVEHHGQATRFFRRGDKYFVRTEGPDGRPRDFEVAYTFGVHPLQQYLIALPGGRLQALGVAWDARRREEGGQRWYHLYPEAPPRAGETTHWTGRDQNWNFMCAACHSTGLAKNYDAERDSYRTTWAELAVGCEACHGPASQHLAWARGDRARREAGLGFKQESAAYRRPQFGFADPAQPIASRMGEASQAAGEMCFGCHARRRELVKNPDPGDAFLDNYLPSLLEPGLYHPDGRIDGEVFEYGSFVQSAMHRAGVTCTHCHETHSLKLRAAGNALCAQCHRTERYDNPEHHHHAAGANCVDCHMPGKTYMGVHFRRDHSLRVPRPEATASDAAIVRASALARLPAPAVAEVAAAAGDRDALVRLGAARALARLAPPDGLRIGAGLLADPVRAVRVEAARSLAGARPVPGAGTLARDLDAALAELIAMERLSADRPESRVNLGQIYTRLGRQAEAEAALQGALKIAPDFVPALVDLADLRRLQKRDAEGEVLLRRAVGLAPEAAEPAHALGLLLVRRGRTGESLAWLEQAMRQVPENAGYALVFALALQETGQGEKGLQVLDEARRRQPADLLLLRAQIGLERRLGRAEAARAHAMELQMMQGRTGSP